jgi:hypothetical protein
MRGGCVLPDKGVKGDKVEFARIHGVSVDNLSSP